MTKAQRDIRRKLRILTYAKGTGNISKACRYFGISREGFYKWKRAYAAYGEKGPINSKPCPENPSLRIPPEIEEKILYLWKMYHLGQLRISWFLERYHGIKVSSGGVYQGSQTQWDESSPSECQNTDCAHPTIRKTGSWPSDPGGCKISQFHAC